MEAKDLLFNIASIKSKSEEENFEIDDVFWDFIESYCLVFGPENHKKTSGRTIALWKILLSMVKTQIIY